MDSPTYEELLEACRQCWVQYAFKAESKSGRLLMRMDGALSALERVRDVLLRAGMIDKDGLVKEDKEWHRSA